MVNMTSIKACLNEMKLNAADGAIKGAITGFLGASVVTVLKISVGVNLLASVASLAAGMATARAVSVLANKICSYNTAAIVSKAAGFTVFLATYGVLTALSAPKILVITGIAIAAALIITGTKSYMPTYKNYVLTTPPNQNNF